MLPAAPGPWPAWFWALVLVLVAGLALALGWLLATRRLERALHEARARQRAGEALAPQGRWASDAAHRLLAWLPPRSPSASATGQPAAGSALWSHFETELPGGLEAAMRAQRPLCDFPVVQRDGSGATRWALDGVPCHDAAGGFSGYIGSARPLDAERARAADLAALDLLLAGSGDAVWLLARDALGGTWRVRRHNAAAARLGGATGAPWPALLDALPDGLGPRVAGLAPGHGLAETRWSVRLERLDDADEARALLLRAGGEGSAEEIAAEHAAFSYTVSHDLRAPIRVVDGFARILKEDYGRLLDRIGNDHLDRVLGAAARMNSMIDALLALAQLSSQPLVRQPVNLSQLAQFVVDDLHRQQPERRVEVHVQPGLAAHGDPTLLRLVLENLVGNAWKYTARRADAAIEFATAQQGGRPVFVVRDNGAGFDMRFADRLFGLFQRLHSANDFQGTGVGLASVRRIVRRHGGDVWAESEVGQGASFYFTLGR